MADVFDKRKRSEVMSRVKSKNTKPEMLLRRALFRAGLRGYRLNIRLPGSPDVVYSRGKVAIFVDGCFWHGCPLCYTEPEQNPTFWADKLAENKARDAASNRALRELGWKVLRFWEHEVEKGLDECVRVVRRVLRERRR